MRIVLLGLSEDLIQHWRRHIDQILRHGPKLSIDITVEQTRLETLSVKNTFGKTAVVSPGNSFGYFGGGLDKSIGELFSKGRNHKEIEPVVQKFLSEGYAPPGNVQLIHFKDEDINNTVAQMNLQANSIIHAPTMRVPGNIMTSNKLEAYRFIFDITWAILTKVSDYNKRAGRSDTIETLVLPALGAGYGNVPHEICSKSILGAITIFHANYDSILKSTYILRFLHHNHTSLIITPNGFPKEPFDIEVDELDKLF